MPSPSFFVRSLVRIASLQGRGVLESVVSGQFTSIATTGGKQMIATSGGGKSYSFQVPLSLSTDSLMASAEEALETFDSLDSAEVAVLLATRPLRKTVSGF